MLCDSRGGGGGGGRGFARFQETEDDPRIFDGFEISIPGFLGGKENLASFLFLVA